jgi:hypothetical protein
MRRLPPSLVALVIVLLAAAPAGALAAEEAPGAPAEAPASEAPPPSGGWVPQTPAAEGGGDAPASAQPGSSLGSGGRSNSAPSTSEPSPSPEPSPPPAPVETYEPEPSASATEESTGTSEAAPEPAPAQPPVAKAKPDPGVPPAVGAADLVARPTSSGEAKGDPEASAAAQVASTVTKDSGGLPWLALILCGLVLLYAGLRLLLGPVEPEFFRSGPFRFVRRVFPGA